jgi:glycosyltransferase involved in cell wall biosynthesis
MFKKNRKVLVCAYSCEPGFSSEQEIGWKWSNLLSEFNDVYVLTRLSNKKTIEDYIQNNNIRSELKFIYYDLPHWAKKWKKKERGLYLYYTLWQWGAYLKARTIHENEKFDIVHYLTFGSLLLPNFMSFMPTKFILGPVGGGENTPLRFIGEFSTKGKITEIIRHIIQSLQIINPLFLIQCYRADKILARTKETYKMIPSIFRNKTELMLETGVPEELLEYKTKESEETKKEIHIITIGRFIHSKINIMTLKVILEFKNRYKIPFKFYIVGDGDERKSLEIFCQKNALEDDVIFTGWVSREKVFTYLSQSDIYYSTTFKEGGSWAFFEAVAMGLPVACLKISGPDMIVSDKGGIKVEPTNPRDVIDKLAYGLYQLSTNNQLRQELSTNAKNTLLENLTWEKMMRRIETTYNEVLNSRRRNDYE